MRRCVSEQKRGEPIANAMQQITSLLLLAALALTLGTVALGHRTWTGAGAIAALVTIALVACLLQRKDKLTLGPYIAVASAALVLLAATMQFGSSRWFDFATLVLFALALAVTFVLFHLVRRGVRESVVRRALVDASESKYADLVKGSPDAIFEVDRGGLILSFNPAAERITGFPAEQILGKHYTSFNALEVETMESMAKLFLEVLQGAPARSVEIPVLRPDGERIWVEVNASKIMRGKEVRSFNITLRDINERKLVAAEREALREQLFEAQRVESMGRLAGGIAHDFNNLLTVIQLYVVLLRKEDADESETEEMWEETQAAVHRAAELTSELLSLGRRQHLAPEELDLNELVRGNHRLYRSVLPENILLEVVARDPSCPVHVDGQRIQQVLLNLVINARDAMQQGGTLRIEVGSSRASADTAWVQVTDTGSGMAPSIVERIFDPFFSTKSPGVGTGLGLSVARGIVEQSGGKLTVKSEVGAGTTFQISLPLWTEAAPMPEHADEPRVAPTGDESILVVDDNAAVARTTQMVLAQCGYDAVSTTNVAAAKRIVQERQLDLLITDLVMPQQGGTQLFADVRERVPRVLYLTGYLNNELVPDPPPAQLVLTKPFDDTALIRRVRQLLDTPLPD